MRRLLFIGTSHPEQIEDFYQRAFRRLGVEVIFFDLESRIRPLLRSRIVARLTWPLHHRIVHQQLLRLYERPVWDAVFVVKGYQLAAETITICKRQASGIPWAVLNPDSPFETGRGATSRHIREAVSLYDLHFIWSRQLLSALAAAGSPRPVYLPFAHDEQSHRPASADEMDPSLAGTVSFVGTHDAEREAVLEQIADMPLRIYGGGWDRLSARSRLRGLVRPPARGRALRTIVSSSLVSLNILRAQNHGAHNMRTFEVPAMRGTMLTRRSEEQQAFFPEGEAALMYETTAELRASIEALRAMPSRAESLRQQALERAAGHTYTERARLILRHLRAL